MTDSATGGYVQPAAAPAPAEGQDLDRFIQQIVVAVAGYNPASLVRPRWQPKPPNQPEAPEVNWCAVGVTTQAADYTGATVHSGGDELDDGEDEFQRHETVTTLLSFYGPLAGSYAEKFREGIQVAQNREAMTAVAMGFLDTGDIIRVPELVNGIWNNRMDMLWRTRRLVRRVYPMLNVLSAAGFIVVDEPPLQIPFLTTPPN